MALLWVWWVAFWWGDWHSEAVTRTGVAVSLFNNQGRLFAMVPLTAYRMKLLGLDGAPPGSAISVQCLQKALWKKLLKQQPVVFQLVKREKVCEDCTVLERYRKACAALDQMQALLDEAKLKRIP